MKGIGLCLLVAAGGGVGCLRAAALRERVHALGGMCRFIDWLMREIRYSAAPLDVLFRRATASALRDFPLSDTVNGFGEWQTALTNGVKVDGFTEEDLEHIRRFAEELGGSDVAGQLAHGAFYAALFEERRKQAHEEAEKRGRLEVVLWTSSAAVLALLWI